MDVNKRMLVIKILKEIKQNPEYAKVIGVSDISVMKVKNVVNNRWGENLMKTIMNVAMTAVLGIVLFYGLVLITAWI